ncbi:right-handed parallel beta-helix repeat-containing protein [Lysinibacillus sp. NPDC097287]|uniref:right-handed parallel beta-helix repeat-containing protein n=1 Tax=Lysinibacillus sp. NPDC097287 TaxID=3364144 RepID=UPI00381E7476
MKTIIVKKSLLYRYQTIGQAIQDAEAGDQIEINGGIYEEIVDVSKRLKLYGKGDVTIKGSVFIRYNVNAEMCNIRFSQGRGMYVKGNLHLENCVVEQQTGNAQVTVNYGSLAMKNVDILGNSATQYGLRIDNGSSVMLETSTIQHHSKAQIIVQNSELTMSRSKLLEGKANGIFALKNVQMDLVDCEIHGHDKAQILLANSSLSVKSTLIHQGQDTGIQALEDSKVVMDNCEVKQHRSTDVIVYQSELRAVNSVFADGPGKGIYVGELSKAIIYDCEVYGHVKPQIFIENSRAEIRKCNVRNGSATGIHLVNEADVLVTESEVTHHKLFHVIVDSSGLQMDNTVIHQGQSGGIFGNEHAKITLKDTTIRELKSHLVYLNNCRLFTDNCTFSHIQGNGISCIDSIFEISNSQFNDCFQGPYSILWSDKSIGRVENGLVDETERTFFAVTNGSLIEIINTNLANVKLGAVVQENSNVYVRGHHNEANWQRDASSRIVNTASMPSVSKEKVDRIVNIISGPEAVDIEELSKQFQIPDVVIEEVHTIIRNENIKKSM